jgi:phosphoesterase RecJ-like protein
VAGHRNPDGDAVGSVLGLARALSERGADVVVWHPDGAWVPEDLAFLLRPGEDVATEPPADMAERTLVALDCASGARLADDATRALPGLVVNVDHHHDNTRFGGLNLVEPGASSTAEVVVHIMEAAGWPVSPAVAEPLYVGLITDTGRFCYSNTTPEAHRVAAVLISSGIDAPGVARRIYEDLPATRLRIMGRALAGMRTGLDGRLVTATLTADDLRGAGGRDAEGVAEALRATRGAEVAALLRELGDGAWRVSLRAASDRVDVSSIAHEEGGGGHRAAAGFTSRRTLEDLLAWLDQRVAAHLNGAGEKGGG